VTVPTEAFSSCICDTIAHFARRPEEKRPIDMVESGPCEILSLNPGRRAPPSEATAAA
jgi:hypothetical protein